MPEDVTPADPSPADSAAAQPAEPAPEPVSSVQGDDRPVQNVVAEFNRKMSKLQSQYDTLAQYIAAQAQARPAAQAQKDPTDDELWSLAQQGDRNAFDLYMRRIASQESRVNTQQFERDQLVGLQIQALTRAYPFADATSPISQQATATYQAMIARGYPANHATLLDAMKNAILDRPDIVAETYQKTRPASVRRDAAQAGVIGATVRQAQTPVAAKPVSEAEAALARRMGIKDPAKAKERFEQRQASGQSSLGSVAAFVKEE